jgi:redox-sensitive bicupin YhaK (pirin superfamily)
MTHRQTLITSATPSSREDDAAQGIKLASGFRLRPAETRGLADHGWLKSAHSFSFASYFDRNYMQFEALRVINDDQVAAGGGFPMHPHQNAEIFSYILDGALSHKDTLGNGSTVKSGGVQYMSAGSGVRHSEYNASETDEVAFLQVWLLPNVENEAPRYETMDIKPEDKDGKLKLFLSKNGREGSMSIKADADIYAATLKNTQSIIFDMPRHHKAWIQMARGALSVNGQSLHQGDGLAVTEAGRLVFEKGQDAEFLLFDLAKSP